MLRFIKKLYHQRLKDITIILLDDSKPGEDNSFTIRPNNIFVLFGISCLVLSVIFVGIFMITPLGALLYTKEDAQMRVQIEGISRRVLNLQDSLIVRDRQLNEMKNVIRLSLDTTLVLDSRFGNYFEQEQNAGQTTSLSFEAAETVNRVNPSGIVFSNILESAADFPTAYPVKGTRTRGYEPEDFHFGIDIATNDDEIITAIADGTIVNASWTVTDGYVLTIQHAGGVLSIYKHSSSVTKKSGDIVLKGDIIGTTGDVGVNSSGPHLHLEIWKNGLPQDPGMYLIQ
jgi:murein DD-endopeptidase MepM/ murein hydrolase activator NlpD